MDIAELEGNLFAACDAKLHGGMYKTFSAIYCKVLSVFPSLEDARPRSRSGIQALCSLHIALEKAKNVLQHCSGSSKLYLAITSDSVLLKFEKARSGLEDSLKRVEDIVPQSIGCQIEEIVNELEGVVLSLDPSEKRVGDEIIALLQQGKKFDNSVDCAELESFHNAATKLGITSSRAALTERRALKKLIERARVEEDKRKESIVAYLLHLMRKYSKLFRSEVSVSVLDVDNDSQGSSPRSPAVCSSDEKMIRAFDRQLSKLSSFNFKPSAAPPEELRCPISLQLMYDPVIVSSGQTYERACIEKWIGDGHNTCPKTQQELSHSALTPNFCVKGLIVGWCEHNGVPAPTAPPEPLDLNCFHMALSESANSRSTDSIESCKDRGIKIFPLEEAEDYGKENVLGRYEDFLSVLNGEESLEEKGGVVEQIRVLLKDDEEARILMGDLGFVDALLRFLEAGEGNSVLQGVGAMALFNLAVNNNRNKQAMLAGGVIPILEQMASKTRSHKAATALYLSLSSLEEAKPVIASSTQAVAFLVHHLESETNSSSKLDSLHALYNLSTHPPNVPNLLSANTVTALQRALPTWPEKCIALILNLAASESGKNEMGSNPGLINGLATVLDCGEAGEQERAVSCLLVLCDGNEKCCRMVLQEGVIPGLVSVSVSGTARGKEKAQKLLVVFREQRQRDQPVVEDCYEAESVEPRAGLESSSSRRTMGKALSFLWKSKSHSSVKSCS